MKTTIEVQDIPNERNGGTGHATLRLACKDVGGGLQQLCLGYSLDSRNGVDPFAKITIRCLVWAARKEGWNTQVKYNRPEFDEIMSNPRRSLAVGALRLYHQNGEPMLIHPARK